MLLICIYLQLNTGQPDQNNTILLFLQVYDGIHLTTSMHLHVFYKVYLHHLGQVFKCYLGVGLSVRVALQNVSYHRSIAFFHCPVQSGLTVL